MRQKRAASSLICENSLFLDEGGRQIELSLVKRYRSGKAFDEKFSQKNLRACYCEYLDVKIRILTRYRYFQTPSIHRIHLGRLSQTPRQNTYFPLPLAVIY